MVESNSLNADDAIRLARECHETGEFERAIHLYEQLADLLSADQRPGIDCNLGMALKSVGRIDESIAAYRRAIAGAPNVAAPLNNLANLLKDVGDLDEAFALFDRAFAIAPRSAGIVNNRAAAMEAAGRIDEAIAGYRQAATLAPDLPNPSDNLVYAMHFSSRYTARDLLIAHLEYATRFAEPLRSTWPTHSNDRSSDRRLKVGWVSPDLREHVVGRFLLPLFEHHQREQFEFVAYSNSFDDRDQTAQRLQRAADVWMSIAELDDESAATLIHDDRIDILIDLSLHMTRNRLGVFARKPAPIQATYLAYASTSGLAAMDYRITDPDIDPIGHDESVYVEQSIRLPSTYWCYEPMPQATSLDVSMRSGGPITFGCLNNFNKCSTDARETWRSILQRVANSRLLLHARPGSHREALCDYFAEVGLERSRIDFVGIQSLADYFATYRRIDIALDPFPYGGGTTTCDALWMGVPVITLKGQTAVGRGGVSILTNVGHPELIAETREQYERLAITLAQNPVRLDELRASLRGRMQHSPMMDAPRFARDFETTLRTMWKHFTT